MQYCIAIYSTKIFFHYPVFKFGISCMRGSFKVILYWCLWNKLKFGICGSLYFGRHQKTISMQSCLRLPPRKLWPIYFLIITRKYLFGKSLIYNGIHVCFRNKRFVIGFSKWQTKQTYHFLKNVYFKCIQKEPIS